MNRSYSKIRHIQESNHRLERRLLNEQVTGDTQSTPLVKIGLPNGNYIGDGSGYEYEILDLNDAKTGYSVKAETGIRGYKSDDKVTISDGIPTSETWGVGGTYSFENVGYKPQAQPEQISVSSKLSEGIKNVTPQMIQSPPFKGNCSGYVFGGDFNGVKYQWDGSGVSGMTDIGGPIEGLILSENNSYLAQKGITDADPNGVWVGFLSDNRLSSFACYKTTEGTIKCLMDFH